LVWLSLEGWIATSEAADSKEWNLEAGGGHQGTIVITSPTTFEFSAATK
jgi:hypothetical protein